MKLESPLASLSTTHLKSLIVFLVEFHPKPVAPCLSSFQVFQFFFNPSHLFFNWDLSYTVPMCSLNFLIIFNQPALLKWVIGQFTAWIFCQQFSQKIRFISLYHVAPITSFRFFPLSIFSVTTKVSTHAYRRKNINKKEGMNWRLSIRAYNNMCISW